MESVQSKLSRVRTPRVHITYDVETGGAIAKKELPFVVGIMGDFAGENKISLKPLKDRRFVQIDKDNFDDVLKRMNPKLEFKIDNTLTDEEGLEMSVSLEFNSLADFEPAAVVNQVEPLRKLMETRNKLRDLMTKVDRSEELEDILEKVLSNSADLEQLASELDLGEKV